MLKLPGAAAPWIPSNQWNAGTLLARRRVSNVLPVGVAQANKNSTSGKFTPSFDEYATDFGKLIQHHWQLQCTQRHATSSLCTIQQTITFACEHVQRLWYSVGVKVTGCPVEVCHPEPALVRGSTSTRTIRLLPDSVAYLDCLQHNMHLHKLDFAQGTPPCSESPLELRAS